MEKKVNHPLRTLNQLPLLLKGFRKARGLTQAVLAEKLGITQQSYAYFEANAATATLDRLFMVLRLLGVEIALNQVDSATSMTLIPADAVGENIPVYQPSQRQLGKTARTATIAEKKPSAAIQPVRVISGTNLKENW